MPRPAFGRGDSMSIISEKGAGMAIKDVLPRLRRERGLTQEDLAKKLFITRQAVSRWETGETAPGIDMTKLIAVTLDVHGAVPTVRLHHEIYLGDPRRTKPENLKTVIRHPVSALV